MCELYNMASKKERKWECKFIIWSACHKKSIWHYFFFFKKIINSSFEISESLRIARSVPFGISLPCIGIVVRRPSACFITQWLPEPPTFSKPIPSNTFKSLRGVIIGSLGMLFRKSHCLKWLKACILWDSSFFACNAFYIHLDCILEIFLCLLNRFAKSMTPQKSWDVSMKMLSIFFNNCTKCIGHKFMLPRNDSYNKLILEVCHKTVFEFTRNFPNSPSAKPNKEEPECESGNKEYERNDAVRKLHKRLYEIIKSALDLLHRIPHHAKDLHIGFCCKFNGNTCHLDLRGKIIHFRLQTFYIFTYRT